MDEETQKIYNSDIRLTTERKVEEGRGLFSIDPTKDELERLSEPLLDIKVGYERPRTQEDVEGDLNYYQWRFSQKAGREVPRDEIEVESAGIMVQEKIGFRKKLGESLYIGLNVLHQEAPYVLPKLIEDLRNYEADQNLGDKETILIKEAITGLKGIVNNKYEDLEPGVDFVDLTQFNVQFEDTTYLEDALRMGYTEEQLKEYVKRGELFEGAAMSATPEEDGTDVFRYYSVHEENAGSLSHQDYLRNEKIRNKKTDLKDLHTQSF